jgi:hypothetical protein
MAREMNSRRKRRRAGTVIATPSPSSFAEHIHLSSVPTGCAAICSMAAPGGILSQMLEHHHYRQKVPKGLANPWPMISKAGAWIGWSAAFQ